MKIIRLVLGQIILFFDGIFKPKSMERTPEDQARVDALTSKLALYQFEACPFCVKVRRAMKRMGLNIELRDAAKSKQYAEELLKGGGESQVPCLRIPKEDGTVQWMYESDDIIQYLGKLVAN